MAVVSRTATLKFRNTALGDAGGFRQWQATAASQDFAAGANNVITVAMTSGGASPPSTADTLTLNVYKSDGTTLQQSFTLTPGTASQNVNFAPATSGTFILDIRATKTTGGPTATYDYETDGSPGTPPSLNSAATVDRGYVRATTSATQTLSNASLGGGDTSPYQYLDNLYLRTVLAAALNTARACTNIVRDAGAGTTRRSSSPAATTDTFDSTFSGTSTSTGRVNSGFPAASGSYETHFTLPNNALTGIAETTVTLTRDTATIDPRLTAEHLLQIDNNTFASPPFSDPNVGDQRVFPQNGYVATNLRGARGSYADPNISGGLNGLSFDITFVAQATGQNFGGVSFVTGTVGGEAGWQTTFLIWTAVVGGQWTKTILLQQPDLSDAYLIGASVDYALIAANPAIRVVLRAAPRLTPARAFAPGRDLEVRANLFNVDDRQIIAPDDVGTIIIARLNRTTLIEEFLDSDLSWQPMLVGGVEQVAYAWDTVPGSSLVAGGSPNLFFLRFDPVDTADFDYTDLVIIGTLFKDGSPYSAVFICPVVNAQANFDYETAGLVRQILDAGGSVVTAGRHLSGGDGLRLIMLPRRNAEFIPYAATNTYQLSCRYVPSVAYDWWPDKPGGAGWIAANDVSHPNGGDLIFIDAPTISPVGNAVWNFPTDFTTQIISNNNGFTATAKLGIDVGLDTERFVTSIQQFEVVGNANPHHANEFDATGLFK
jgi:hypothetical protein